MPRVHKHKPGTQFRRNYPLDNIEKALEAIIGENISFVQAAERFGVPATTIWRKFRGMTSDKLGRPPALSVAEEKTLVEMLLTAAKFGYPFTRPELKRFVQGYLNRKGKNVPCFQDNLPGEDWCDSFENRNPELSRRNCENMKRSKAKLSPEIVQDYFNEMIETLQDVPSAAHVLNYDETNISDDPGHVKVFVKRGAKHASRIMDSSKSSNSVMFAVFGDGTMLPPYVVYKAKNLYPEWVENGPRGTRYNRSVSGWFDGAIFEDWFVNLALPYLKRKEGKKVLIGDNLSSHLSPTIIRLCMENNIAFVFLPPNSTHVCQPLDVSVFAPLKKVWRQVLTEWKTKNKGVVPKPVFPSLLKKLLDRLEPKMKQNILSGFEGAGLIPFDPECVIQTLVVKRRNEEDDNSQVCFEQTFYDMMKDKTIVDVDTQKVKRSKKFNVPAGKSVTLGDLPQAGSSRTENNTNYETEEDNEPEENN